MGEGGRIVTVGSMLADRASFPGLADYVATKAAVVGYTKGAARDLGPRGITVNVVQPGSIDTDMNPKDGGEFAEAQRKQHALQRFGPPEEDRRRRRVPRQPGSLVRDRHRAQRRWRLRRLIETTQWPGALRPAPLKNQTSQDSNKGTIPMIELRPFAKLGGADHGWLKAKHHFSFGSHYDPDNMGHGSLAGVER